MLVCNADLWPLPGQASGLAPGKTQSHFKTQPSLGKTALYGQQPTELPSEVPARDKVTKNNVCSLPGFGNLESQDYRGSEEPALHSTDEETEAQRGEETCPKPHSWWGQSRN